MSYSSEPKSSTVVKTYYKHKLYESHTAAVGDTFLTFIINIFHFMLYTMSFLFIAQPINIILYVMMFKLAQTILGWCQAYMEQKIWDHITPVLAAPHWLPVRFRIDFKILLATFKALHCLAPDYISNLLVPENKRGGNSRSGPHGCGIICLRKSGRLSQWSLLNFLLKHIFIREHILILLEFYLFLCFVCLSLFCCSCF